MKLAPSSALGSIAALALAATAALLPTVAADQLRFPPADPSPITSFSSQGGSRSERVLSHHDNAELGHLKGQEGFTVLQHEHFPDHSVRIKENTGWCDPIVDSYSGYIDVGFGRELFFYYFSSRSKPEEDPLLVWINGGPGCSSSMGLLMELGPCTLHEDDKGNITTKPNPHSWNDKANVFFLDEPIGVGYSYAEHGQVVGRAEAAALDVQAFVAIFIETFKEFKGRPLTLSGESYGGRYLPVFAAAIYDGNKALVEAGGTAVNLKSIAIGNGITDSYSMVRGYYEHSCTKASGLGPIIGVAQCQAMALALPHCEELIKKECLDREDLLGCKNAMSFCGKHISTPFFNAQLNPYDISQSCTPEQMADSLCYPQTKVIRKYLDQPHVRALLGVNPDLGPFESCSPAVGQAFHLANDGLGKTWYYVAALLEHGIDVLLYIGKYDWICNSSGNKIWSDALEWTHGPEFKSAELRDWTVDGKVAGQVKKAKNLTFMTIDKAGHMVPMDQPEASLQMINRWLAGEDQ